MPHRIRLSEKPVQELWSEYKRTGARELRDELIVRYLPLVKFVARRVSVGLPSSIEQGDLVSYGTFGLIDAIEKFEPERGIKFETYAITRIQGSVIDELRSIDWVPRSVRVKVRAIEKSFARLEGQLLRAPSPWELATDLGITEDELQARSSEGSFVGVAALDEVLVGAEAGENATLADALSDHDHSPATAFEIEEMKRSLAYAIDCLGDREKIVLTLYYYERLTLADIGQVLGVTESRVCQIHTKAVAQLQREIKQAERRN